MPHPSPFYDIFLNFVFIYFSLIFLITFFSPVNLFIWLGGFFSLCFDVSVFLQLTDFDVNVVWLSIPLF